MGELMEPTNEAGGMLDVAAISAKLNVHEQTIRRWLRAGTLPGFNFGGAGGWRVDPADLTRFLATKRNKPAHDQAGDYS